MQSMNQGPLSGKGFSQKPALLGASEEDGKCSQLGSSCPRLNL